jgi:CheY-like chemotaxis protein
VSAPWLLPFTQGADLPVSKPRILLVDDSVTIQKVVNLTFADQGMEVVAIGDSVTAIEQFDQTKPDLVLADVHMPGMSGYQLCELIRSDKANRDIPIVLLVGSFEPFDREEAIRVGASASITKPFSSIGELVSTVRQLIDESRSRAQSSPATPAPDTSDIDNLYQQSFVETVRLPEDLREEVEFVEFADNELDDEMIETSYVIGDEHREETAPVYDPEEILSTSSRADDFQGEAPSVKAASSDTYGSGTPSEQAGETGAAERTDDEFHSDTYLPTTSGPTEPRSAPTEEREPENYKTEEMPAAAYSLAGSRPGDIEIQPLPAEAHEDSNAEPALANVQTYDPEESDPFASFAEELPIPPLGSDYRSSRAATFEGDDDLLELPSTKTPGPIPATEPEPSSRALEVSPELIDLIVEKVVARLEERAKAGTAGS